MINNLLVTSVLNLESSHDPERLVELMSFLNETKLMNVRYTQSTEELKLMKIAVYIQQRFRQNATTEDVILIEDPIP